MAVVRLELSPARRKARRRRSRRRALTVIAFMSPWIIGFLWLYVYPMFASLYFSFTKYDGVSGAPRWTGLTNYRFMFTHDPLFWQSLRNTLWIVAIGVPLTILLGVGTAYVLTKPRRGRSFYRLAFFLPTMVPAVAASIAFLFLLNPSGPIDTMLRFLHVPQPAVVPGPPLVEARSRPARSVGRREHDDHLPGGAPERSGAPVRGGRHRRSERLAEVPPHHAADDQPGDLLLGGDRRDLRVPVLHRGVRDRARRRRSVRTGERSTPSATRWDRRSSTRSGSTSRGSSRSTSAYASAMAWILFVIVMACTLVLIKSSNRWVFYQGGFR